jgi:hypothetical protein
MPALIALVVSVALAATWLLVSNDWWPLDDRNFPATAVWAFNGAVGTWFAMHGEREPEAPPPKMIEGFSEAEWAQIQKTLRNDPRFRERAFLFRGGVHTVRGAPSGGSGSTWTAGPNGWTPPAYSPGSLSMGSISMPSRG